MELRRGGVHDAFIYQRLSIMGHILPKVIEGSKQRFWRASEDSGQEKTSKRNQVKTAKDSDHRSPAPILLRRRPDAQFPRDGTTRGFRRPKISPAQEGCGMRTGASTPSVSHVPGIVQTTNANMKNSRNPEHEGRGGRRVDDGRREDGVSKGDRRTETSGLLSHRLSMPLHNRFCSGEGSVTSISMMTFLCEESTKCPKPLALIIAMDSSHFIPRMR